MAMSSLDDPAYRLSLALLGFHGARRRCELLGDNAELDEIFFPLTEALWWARSVDEGLEELVGREEYAKARKTDPRGEHLIGLRYARNRAGHERAITVVKGDGRVPGTYPLGYRALAWRPVEDLPPGHPDPKGQAAYMMRLAGQAITDTLNAACEWFAAAQNKWKPQLSLINWPAN